MPCGQEGERTPKRQSAYELSGVNHFGALRQNSVTRMGQDFFLSSPLSDSQIHPAAVLISV